MAADFAGSGMGVWTTAGWLKLTDANVQDVLLTPDGEALIADFGAGGLRLFDSAWTKLIGLDPEQILMG